MDIYGRVCRAVRVDGKSKRAVAGEFGLFQDTARKMLQYAVPPGYRHSISEVPSCYSQCNTLEYLSISSDSIFKCLSPIGLSEYILEEDDQSASIQFRDCN